MLSKSTIDKIAAALKLDAAKLTADIALATEVDVELPEVSTFTADELTTRDAAQVAIGKKEGEGIGKTIGQELAVKELKKNFGIEFEGKDLAKLTETVKTQLAKGDEGLKQQVTILQDKLAGKDTEIAALGAAAAQSVLDTKILSSFPKDRAGTLTDAEYLTLVKSTLAVEIIDGKEVVKRGADVIRDPKTTNPLPLSDAIGGFFAERKWIGEAAPLPGGRGGGNTPPGGKPTKMSEAVKAWESQGKNAASAEFQQHVQQLSKENADFAFME